MSSPGGEQSPQPRQVPQIGQEASQTSEMPTLVDVDAIVEPSVTAASQVTPTT